MFRYPLRFLTYSCLYACSSFLIPFSQNASYSSLKTQLKCHFLQEIFPDPPRLLRRPLPTTTAISSTGLDIFLMGALTKILIVFLFEFRVYAFCLCILRFSTCNEYLLNVWIQKRKINLIFPEDSADEKQIVVMKHF